MEDAESQQGAAVSTTLDVSIERPSPGTRFIQYTLLGLAALAGAVLVVTFSWALPEFGSGALRRFQLIASIGATIVGLLGLYSVVRSQDSALPPVRGSQPRDRFQNDDADEAADLLDELLEPEATSSPSGDLVGDEIDDLLDRIDGRVDPYDGLEASYAAEIRNTLREATRQVLVEHTDLSSIEAARAVKTGSWTDDRRAAAFLGGTSAPEPPIEMQLRDWASGEEFDRQVAAATAEIRRLQAGVSE